MVEEFKTLRKLDIIEKILGVNKKDEYYEEEKKIEEHQNHKLIVTKSYCNYDSLGYVFMALEGSPPRGCAIYDVERHVLDIIPVRGKTKRITFVELGGNIK